MKKVGLAALGVVGACAACCAIPLALPLIAGATASGLALLGLPQLQMGIADVALVAVTVGALVFGFGTWLIRRRRISGAKRTDGLACAINKPAGGTGCGCSQSAS